MHVTEQSNDRSHFHDFALIAESVIDLWDHGLHVLKSYTCFQEVFVQIVLFEILRAFTNTLRQLLGNV